MRRLMTVITTLVLMGVGTLIARAGETFRVVPLQSADGQTWGGLKFGVTTPKGIKDAYSVDSKNDIPRSLRLAQRDDLGVTVHALFADKKDTDPLTAISLRYAPGGLDLSTLQGDLGEDGEAHYPRERFQDWWVQDFPDKGIVAFVIRTPGGIDVPQVMLLPRAAVAQAVHSLTAHLTPVSVLIDPHAGEPRVMAFGTTRVTGGISGLPDNEYLNLRLERRLVDGIAGGAMRYVYGASGRYTAEISGNCDLGKGGQVEVKCRIEGDSPYGPVSASGHGEHRIDKADDPGRVTRDTAEVAMADAESGFARAMARLGPPTPDQVRQVDWERLFVNARLAGGDAVTPTRVVP